MTAERVKRRYTTEEAAAALGVPRTTIADWKHNERIMPVGYIPGRGRPAPLYLLEELEPLAQEYRKRAATRRSARSGLHSEPS